MGRRVSGTEGAVQRTLRHTLRAAQAGWAPRRLLILSTYLLGAWLPTVPLPAYAQAQSEIQYMYDAAGNVIGVTRTSAPKPDLTVSNTSVGLITAVGDGSFRFPVTFQVNNIGNATAVATWYDRGYLSATPSVHDTAQALAGYTTHSANLAAGASYTVNTTFTTSTTTAPGTWTLIVKADGGGSSSGQYSPTGPNYVDEFNEFNNTQAVTINLPANPKPDLTVTNLAVGAITENQNGSYNIPVTFQVNNIGSITANATWYDRGYLSTDAVLNDTDQILGSYNTRSTNLASGASYLAGLTFTTTTATAAGNYYLIIKVDGGNNASGQFSPAGVNYVAESDETNNIQSVAITLPVKPDLTVTNVSVGTITENQNGSYNIPVTYQVNNAGGSPAVANWYDRSYLSADTVLHDTDQVLAGNNYRTTNLPAGASYAVSQIFTTSTATAAGSYYLLIKTDGGVGTGQYSPTGANYVAETDETNNTHAVAITLPVKPDLTVINLAVSTITENQNGSYSIAVTYQVNNIGGSAAVANWYDRGYLSTDAVLNDTDQFLGGNNYRTINLVAGGSYTVSETFTTGTATAAGSYYLIVKADGGAGSGQYSPTGANYVAEADETNNTQALAITLPVKPDLTVSNLSVGTIVKNGNGSYNIPVTFQVSNIGGSAAVASWYDRGYLSTDAVLNDTDQLLSGNNYCTTSLAAGSSYTVNLTFTTSTSATAGTYYLFVKTDGGAGTGQFSPTGANYVIEANETNNVASTTIVLP